jgi:hypothetical protein
MRCSGSVRIASCLAAVVACSAATGASAGADPWRALHRPLDVPRLAPGAACPVSRVDRSVDFAGFGIAPGLGRGPAYPVGLGRGTLELAPPENFQSRRWGGQKVLWFVHARYRGPLLVRGRQLDGPNGVRFERGDVPPRELRVAVGESVHWSGQPAGSRGKPSFTRLRAPGCYGYQIDGTTFSRVIVFRGRWAG